MRVFLLFSDQDFALTGARPDNAPDLIQDLELNTLLQAMAGGDEFLFKVAEHAVLTSLQEPEQIVYRQQALVDCLANGQTIREMYSVAVQAIQREKRIWGRTSRNPESVLFWSIEALEGFLEFLQSLRQIAETHKGLFCSEAFTRFFQMVSHELEENYLDVIRKHLKRLAFREGVLVSAELGKGNKGTNYVLRRTPSGQASWSGRVHEWFQHVVQKDDSSYVYEVHERDEAGLRKLSEIRGRGLGDAASALAQARDHILSFFTALRTELAFYIGCLNLYEHLLQKGEATCFPMPMSCDSTKLSGQGLYDVCLSLVAENVTVPNDLEADDKILVMITGANRGGKSTFLRCVGLAQLMMQCGMFVGARAFSANLCTQLFTHFKREEDTSMKSGKFDEELSRMSSIVDRITPKSMLLLNESFAATNEREGSQIAGEVVRALLDSGIKVLYVTHLYELADGLYQEGRGDALFLKAERKPGGDRTFRIREGMPMPTSYAQDLYRRIFVGASDSEHPGGPSVAGLVDSATGQV